MSHESVKIAYNAVRLQGRNSDHVPRAGTPVYLAPETLSNKSGSVNEPVDVYRCDRYIKTVLLCCGLQSSLFYAWAVSPSFAGKCAQGSKSGASLFIVRWKGKFCLEIAHPFPRTSPLRLQT